jgi:hypothetical protein
MNWNNKRSEKLCASVGQYNPICYCLCGWITQVNGVQFERNWSISRAESADTGQMRAAHAHRRGEASTVGWTSWRRGKGWEYIVSEWEGHIHSCCGSIVIGKQSSLLVEFCIVAACFPGPGELESSVINQCPCIALGLLVPTAPLCDTFNVVRWCTYPVVVQAVVSIIPLPLGSGVSKW